MAVPRDHAADQAFAANVAISNDLANLVHPDKTNRGLLHDSRKDRYQASFSYPFSMLSEFSEARITVSRYVFALYNTCLVIDVLCNWFDLTVLPKNPIISISRVT
jgi:hypothetical protein